MSVRDVADLLTIAYEGFNQSKLNNNVDLAADSLEVVALALKHPDAGAFFGGMQLALEEETPFGANDPEVDDNDEGIIDPEEVTDGDDSLDDKDSDADSPPSAPSYEGVTTKDSEDNEDPAAKDQGDKDEEKEDDSDDDQANASLVGIGSIKLSRLAIAARNLKFKVV